MFILFSQTKLSLLWLRLAIFIESRSIEGASFYAYPLVDLLKSHVLRGSKEKDEGLIEVKIKNN